VLYRPAGACRSVPDTKRSNGFQTCRRFVYGGCRGKSRARRANRHHAGRWPARDSRMRPGSGTRTASHTPQRARRGDMKAPKRHSRTQPGPPIPLGTMRPLGVRLLTVSGFEVAHVRPAYGVHVVWDHQRGPRGRIGPITGVSAHPSTVHRLRRPKALSWPAGLPQKLDLLARRSVRRPWANWGTSLCAGD
jgi:hypothetical protein